MPRLIKLPSVTSSKLKEAIKEAGALYHVILRGNSRQEIFFEDRYRFYLLLQEDVGSGIG